MTEMEILQTTTDPIEMDMGDPEIIYSPVLPNPEGDPTDDLTKVTIQGDIYKIKDPEVHEWARAEEKPTYTKDEVGLGNVDNTSDLNKPISNATQTALDNKVDKVAGKGLSTNDFTNDFKTKLEGIEAGAEVNTVNSVAGKTGNVTLDKTDVGLSNVDNTSDLNKPVSTATQSALNGKVDNSTLNSYYTKTETDSALANKVDKIDGKGLSTNDYDDTAKGIVDGVTSALNGKVDKEEGYGLSQNDYSDEEKAKVGEIDNKLDKTENAIRSDALAIISPVTDTAPYIYRQTPVKESFKALMKKIVGASVVWNQLVDSNTTSVTIASGHRYIAKINGTLTFGTSNGSAIAVDGSRNDYFTDITSAFNTTIADYVYTLETSQSGSGIAWLQSYGFFTEDYYAYKQNKLESGCVSAHKTYDGETLLTNTELSPITLRGLLKLSTDKLTVDGDEYNADGSVTRKYGIVELGSLEWTMSTLDRWNTTGLRNLIKKPSGLSEKADIVAEQYKTVSSNDLSGDTTLIGIECNIYGDVKVRNGSTTEKPHGKIAYKLAIPTTEQTTPFTETEIVGSTEEFIDYEVAQGNRDVAIPVGTDTDYYQEMKLPPLPTTSGNHNLIYNIATGFGWS